MKDEPGAEPGTDQIASTLQLLREILAQLKEDRDRIDHKIEDVEQKLVELSSHLAGSGGKALRSVPVRTPARTPAPAPAQAQTPAQARPHNTDASRGQAAAPPGPRKPAPLEPAPAPGSLVLADSEYPPLDEVPIKILRLLEKDDFEVPELSKLISEDPEMADHIKRLASSPMYGASQEFKELNHAVVFLGLRNSLMVALGFSMFERMRQGQGSFEEQWCGRRLILNAVAARELAASSRLVPGESAFLAGLAQDFGLMLLIQRRKGPYKRLLDEHRKAPRPLPALERSLIGGDHAQASAALLRTWRFPAPTIEAVAHHHDAGLDLSTCPALLAHLVVAEGISDFLLYPVPSTYHPMEVRFDELPRKKPIDLADLLDRIARGTKALAGILHVQFGQELEIEGLLERVTGTA